MPHNEALAQRVRAALGDAPELQEKKMFGGVGFLFRGNMACGVHKDALIVRTGSERYEEALKKPHTRPFDLTGKPMSGWVLVDREGCEEDDALREWLCWGIDFARTLPPK